MKFAKDKPVKIVLLGAGGTGGHVAPHLYRLLYAHTQPVKIIIADGDIVEEKNLVRQNFCRADLGQNKAEVLAGRYAAAFGMETCFVPHYIESADELKHMLRPEHYRWVSHNGASRREHETLILIGAVDNNRSRQICHEVFETADSVVYIDSGNDRYTGQVVCGIRKYGKTSYRPVGKVFPSILSDADKFPSELSCAEASVSAPQSIAANVMAAALVVGLVYNIVCTGDLTTRYATFSTKTMAVRATGPKPRLKRRNTV